MSEVKKWDPHPYQMKGVQTLVCQAGAGELLDPGMGKTSVALAAFEALRSFEYAKKMLVIAPIKPMYGTWRQEASKWEDFNHLRFSIIHGSGPEKIAAVQADADIYIVNPEGIKWLFSLYKGELPDWEVLCVDESTKFKNSQSQRFKLLRKHLHHFYYRWILTGTFMPNALGDVFAQVFIMDLGHHLGKYITHYRKEYFHQEGYGGYTYIPRRGAYEEITEKIAHMVLKLDAEDYLDMPELNIIPRYVDLPEEAMAMYKEVETHFITEVQSGTIVAANSGAAGTKCRQIANGRVYDETHEAHFIHDAKVRALEEIVEETNGNPLFIVYEFQHDLDAIRGLLGEDMVCITGVTGPKFENIIERFNSGTIPYLVAHWGSTHGLNIQGSCYHMVGYGLTWNLEFYIQTIWRLYRQGQASRQVLVYLLVARGTLDEGVAETIDHKQNNQEKFEKLLMEYKPSE